MLETSWIKFWNFANSRSVKFVNWNGIDIWRITIGASLKNEKFRHWSRWISRALYGIMSIRFHDCNGKTRLSIGLAEIKVILSQDVDSLLKKRTNSKFSTIQIGPSREHVRIKWFSFLFQIIWFLTQSAIENFFIIRCVVVVIERQSIFLERSHCAAIFLIRFRCNSFQFLLHPIFKVV